MLRMPPASSLKRAVPKAVICLISALAFHEIGTQLPRTVYIALPRSARHPRLFHPPVRVFRFSGPPLTDGVEFHKVDGVEIREIAAHGYVLTPGRYVGAEEVEDDDEPFEEKMKRLTAKLEEHLAESERLESIIRHNLTHFGYGR